ncbi:hypothetical protein EJ110_NYTH38383 [Nymphaea thermarum]|nr:hypothetical protein EJ110_NYTH38383 [Nymphaea thermarum]
MPFSTHPVFLQQLLFTMKHASFSVLFLAALLLLSVASGSDVTKSRRQAIFFVESVAIMVDAADMVRAAAPVLDAADLVRDAAAIIFAATLRSTLRS